MKSTKIRRCEHIRGAWFDAPPEQCEEDAEPGSEFCSAHNVQSEWEEPEDPHDYYED